MAGAGALVVAALGALRTASCCCFRTTRWKLCGPSNGSLCKRMHAWVGQPCDLSCLRQPVPCARERTRACSISCFSVTLASFSTLPAKMSCMHRKSAEGVIAQDSANVHACRPCMLRTVCCSGAGFPSYSLARRACRSARVASEPTSSWNVAGTPVGDLMSNLTVLGGAMLALWHRVALAANSKLLDLEVWAGHVLFFLQVN